MTRKSNSASQSGKPASDSVSAALEELKTDLAIEVPEELAAIYREEAEDHIKQIYGGLNALKIAPNDLEQLQNVRRSAHTLKGASGAVGIRVVTKLSHRMEDLLDWLYDNKQPLTPDRLTLLLDTTDRLHDLSFGEFDHNQIAEAVGSLYQQYDAQLAEATQVTDHPAEHKQPATASKPIEKPSPASEPKDEPKKSPSSKKPTHTPAPQGQMLRVPLGRIDDVVSTVSELIINRTTFEQRMGDFVGNVQELGAILERLRAVAAEMETRYSVDALGENPAFHRAIGPTPNQLSYMSQTNDARMSEFDSLEFDRYSEFHLLTRSVSEVSNDVNSVTNELRNLIGDFDTLLARQDRLSRDTQDRLMKVRMVPLATLSTRLNRAARVVARNQDKQVDLVITGEDTEIDKTVLEEIAEPLMHLVRNCVDHGLEQPEEREANGKPKQSTVRLKAFYQGTQVVIRISDDGRGLNHEKIATAAVKKGYLKDSEVASMTPQELYPYIFVPGLSTASALSEVSGRGVGMDIVRNTVQKLKGTITVDSEVDKGTTFTIRLPLTLAVTRALLVVAGNELFALPMQSVVQIARVERSAIERLGSQPVIRINDNAYPLVRLADQLHLRESDDDSPTIPILIVRSGDVELAVHVERIVAGRDIVVKTLGSHLQSVDGLIGATLLGDGTVVPILDPNAISGSSQQSFIPTTAGRGATARGELNIMIVDDSVSVRRVMENLVKSNGWKPMVAKDGVDALEILQSQDRVPDMFLLDVEMPRMDGYELLSTLRGMPETQDIPIVMVTSRSGEKHRQKAFSLGATDYLVKPYQDEQLINLVKRLTSAATVG